MRNIIYDYVIPLGDRCNCTQNLKHYNLRTIGRKLPFDWLKNGDIWSRVNIILEDFADFLNPTNLRQVQYERPEHWQFYRFYDVRSRLIFAHDFPKDLNFVDGLRVATTTFAPKIQRFQSIFAQRKKVLFVYMTDSRVPNGDIRRAVRLLRQKFGYDDIDILVVENGVRTIWNLRRVWLGRGITKFKTRKFLMPVHYTDTTPEQYAVLDKIFSHIRVSDAE